MAESPSQPASIRTTGSFGKLPIALREVKYSVNWIRSICHLELKDETIVDDAEKKTRCRPLGLAVGILPWNYPISQGCMKIASALLTGNTIIIKPSPFTPYCGLKVGELTQRFFPPGVVQVLSGDDNLGPWLVAHPGVDKISFTGSTATGKKIMASAAKTLKRVTLELGGNDPAIVCKDVNVETVAKKIAGLAFYNSGQICLAVKRIYVHESIFGRFRDSVVEYVQNLKVGDGFAEGIDVGPVQNSMQFDKVMSFISDIEKENWNVAVGGKQKEGHSGYFIEPTVIDRPSEDSRILTEEPFGPIVPILAWTEEEDVIAKANNTKMGLGASVWSNDLETARKIAQRLEAGSVWINIYLQLYPLVPYGGCKDSGIGHEGGIEGLKVFCNIQCLFLKKNI